MLLKPIKSVIKIINAVKMMKWRKLATPSEVNTEMIVTNTRIGLEIMVKFKTVDHIAV